MPAKPKPQAEKNNSTGAGAGEPELNLHDKLVPVHHQRVRQNYFGRRTRSFIVTSSRWAGVKTAVGR